jgi:uncharacterized membrane protein
VIIFLAGLAVFLGVHSISVFNRPWRDAMVANLGELPWKGLYSLASLAGFLLLVQGYDLTRAAPVVLYQPPAFLRHIAFALLLPVFPLVVASQLPAGHIKARLKHPMLVATKAWALAHLLVNGALADVILFGGLLAWAVAVRISCKRRGAPIPVAGPRAVLFDGISVVAGLVLYLAFVWWLHSALIGVAVN